MKDFRFQITMKQVPFDSDKYSLRFDRKYVLHNQDKNQSHAVLRIGKSLSKLVLREKVCQKAILANFCKFYSFLQTCLKAKSSLESKILEFGFNPHTSLTLAQTFTLTLLRSISKAQNAQMRLEGSKIWVYIVIIGEGKLKGHQINGSLPLGNITRNLSLPQLIPHFSNLHWRMDNFGLPYRIELRFGT